VDFYDSESAASFPLHQHYHLHCEILTQNTYEHILHE